MHFDGGDGPTTATFNNTIIDGVITGVGSDGSSFVGGYNLFASVDPGIMGTGNQFSQPAQLGPLADNGGPTMTHALPAGSPAINAGSTSLSLDQNGNLLTTDQRGEHRIRFGTVDIGAVENEFEEARSLVVTTNNDDGDSFDGLTSLREAIDFANDPDAGLSNDGDADGNGLVEDTITFDASVFTGGDNSLIRLTQGELLISDSLIIDGTSVVEVVITGDADDDDINVTGTHITDASASFGGTLGASDDLLDDNSRVLNFNARSGDLTLEGLTITGGRLNNAGVGYMGGGGVRFGGRQFFGGTLTLNESTVSGNSASGLGGSRLDGGGIQTYSGDILLNDTTVSGNYSVLDGGGIRTDEGNVSLTNSTVTGNNSRRNGGGVLTDEGDISLTNSEVSENVSRGGGGGLQARGDISLANSTVSGNVSGGIGGGIRASNGDVLLNDSVVSGNSSNGNGGGIGAYGANITLINSTVSGNGSGNRGGGIGASTGDVSLTNSTVSGNTSSEDGGGIGTGGGDVLLINSTINENISSGDGGGISANNVSLNDSSVNGNTSRNAGGGIKTSFGDVSLDNSTVSDNSSNSDQGSEGGGIRTLTGNVSLTDSTLSGNSSTGDRSNGGGISTNSGSVTLTNSTLSGNSTTGSDDGSEETLSDNGSRGGGIFTDSGRVSITSSTISGNSVSGYRSNGGGVSTNSGSVTLTNSTLSGNSTSGSDNGSDDGGDDGSEEPLPDNGSNGGGIFTDFGRVSVTSSTISGNSVAGYLSNGGGIYSGNSSVLITNSTITGNSAESGGGIRFTTSNSFTSLSLLNSIVAGNLDNGTAPDLLATADEMSDETSELIVENTLIGSVTGSGITTTTGSGNILNQSAQLAALADNGGSTQTHALLSGSPAIDGGNNALAVDENGNPLATDQIGQNRLFDGNDDGTATVDIGAFEDQAIRTAGQHIFYNNSGFDGTSNSDAIATDKVALRNDETATFENYTSYVNGINGIAIDLFNPGTLIASDIGLRFGNSDDVATYETLDSSSTIINLTTVVGVGVNGSDRVFIEFTDGAITNGWLQVTVLANNNTGLTDDDVFYFGNVIGESGNDPTDAIVNLADVSGPRTNQTGFGTTDVLNVFDFNRDAVVNLADLAIARTNQSGFTPVRLITPTDASGGPSNKVLPSTLANAAASVALPVNASTPDEGTSEAEELNFASFAVATTVPTAAAERIILKEAPQRNSLTLVGANLETQNTQQNVLDRVFETTELENDLARNVSLSDIDSLFETSFSADL